MDLIDDDSGPQLRLQVGIEAVLDVQYEGERLRIRTKVRGWKEGGVIFIDTPTHEGAPLQLQKTGELTCRLISEGELVTFDTHVVRKILEPVPLWCLSFPKFTSMRRLRGDLRIPTGLPGKVNDDVALVVDLGRGGARIQCPPAASVLDVGQKTSLTFTLPGASAPVELEVTVRAVGPEHLSVQFDEAAVPDAVANFVEDAHAVFQRPPAGV